MKTTTKTNIWTFHLMRKFKKFFVVESKMFSSPLMFKCSHVFVWIFVWINMMFLHLENGFKTWILPWWVFMLFVINFFLFCIRFIFVHCKRSPSHRPLIFNTLIGEEQAGRAANDLIKTNQNRSYKMCLFQNSSKEKMKTYEIQYSSFKFSKQDGSSTFCEVIYINMHHISSYWISQETIW